MLTNAVFTGGSIAAWGVIGRTTISAATITGGHTGQRGTDDGPVVGTTLFQGKLLTNAILHVQISAPHTGMGSATRTGASAVYGAADHGFRLGALTVPTDGGTIGGTGQGTFATGTSAVSAEITISA